MNLADRYILFFEARGLRLGWGSFVRMLVAALVVTLGVSWLLPARGRSPDESAYAAQIGSPDVFEVGADRGDQRGFFPTPVTDDQFRIVWIGGSSLQGVDPDRRTFAPAEFRRQVSKIDGRQVVIDMYFLSGMRIVDELAAVQIALDSNPDLVVVTLNPLWVLNDRAVHGWSNLDGRWFASSIRSPSSWPLTASFVGPSDAAWGTVGSRVGVVRDRYDWGRSLKELVGDWSPLTTQPPVPPAADEDVPELARIAQMQIPVFFWDEYSSVQPAGASTEDRQAALFDYEADNASGIPSRALGNLFGALATSGVPSFVYLAQIDDEMVAAPQVDAALARVELAVAESADEHASENLQVVPQSAIRTIGDMNFRDPIHAFEIEPLVDYLTPLICSFLETQELESSCAN